jgi:L-iduronidase
MNNECDPQVGWRDVHTWHAKPYYAAFIAKMISQHQRRLVDEMGVPYVILSNDNGFTGVWGNRTHLARQGKKDQLERGEFALIKKPALNVMTMLALLGDAQVAVDGQGDVADDLGVIATRRGDDQIAVLVYHSRDRIMSSGCETVLVDLTGLPFAAASLVHYRIDEAHGNPFGVWEAQFGNPALPRHDTPESIAAMRAVQELEALDAPREVALPGGTLSLTFDLPLHTVSLILLTAKPAEAPEAVVGLTAEVYPGMFPETQEDVMLLWEPLDSRALHTYEVLHATAPEGPFERINTQDLLCGAFLHARPKGQAGHYRVRAVDYWGRPGMATEAMAI